MVKQTIKLGGTASDVTVARVAHGLMMMTWIPTPVPDEQCFEAIKAGIDALPPGAKMFLNSGEFYAMDMQTGNLEMLARFFEKHPGYAEKTFLSVKGGINREVRGPDNSEDKLRASVDNILRALGPHKKLDLFEPARIDRKVPVEDMMRTLSALVKEGKFTHIGLSECNADTLRKAHAVHPVTAVEIEVSPFSFEDRTRAVIDTAAELGGVGYCVFVSVAYSQYWFSPLGRGILTGKIKSAADLQEGDIRFRYSRFKAENIEGNLPVVDALEELAKRKGVTVAQLCIAWVAAQGPSVIPLPGSSKATRTLENLEAGDIVFNKAELDEMSGIIEKYGVKGDRGMGFTDEQQHYWG
ncbi:Aldo/keto reductase [Mycena sanguinolenta]|uniref:Aldo/keto reductase n=1 Tax=Mycena sanguinolenta TaxID=230812 RepID=A0A8H6YUP5_9AGAR|nr:Aldo/keto reductase [Mycena sanguinolenta]